MTHVVEIAATTHYKVYVEDATGKKTTVQILEEAKKQVYDGLAGTDPELPVEEGDIVSAYIDYDLED